MGKLRDKAFVNVLATPTSFFKIKNGYLRKSQKTELATKLKKPLKESYSAAHPPTEQKWMIAESILESKGMRVIFQKKGNINKKSQKKCLKRAKYLKIWAKMY